MYKELLDNQISNMQRDIITEFQEYDNLDVKEGAILALMFVFSTEKSRYIREFGETNFFLDFIEYGIMPVFNYDSEEKEYTVVFYRKGV